MTEDLARVPAVLAALARGILGPGYVPEIPDRMVALAGRTPLKKDRDNLFAMLRLADTRAGALLLTGRAVPVSWLSAAEAEAVVQRWKWSRIPVRRQIAGAVITLATTSLYGYPGPAWDRMGYGGPLGDAPTTRKALAPIELDEDTELSCDVVIVGSGAGGGCAAAQLAAAGLDVVVLEKGGYFSESDFHHREVDAMREMYLYGGTLMTTDLNIRIIAGSTVGGGTLVNFATAFLTPDRVLREWAQVSGIGAFADGEMHDSLSEVAARVNVTTEESIPGRRDSLMEEGLEKLGWHCGTLARAVRGCTQDAQCGYCGYGCRPGAKQGTLKTFLEDAAAAGARIVTGANVRTVTIAGGRATGVEGTVNGHRLRVAARAVVSACGSIETPALLLRSGLRGEVGKNLRLHPATGPWAAFDEDIRVWEGTTMARFSREFADWDGGYGPVFETIPTHPGGMAAMLPWLDAAQHRREMERLNKLSYIGVLLRDTSGGRVRIAKDGTPLVDYKLNAADRQRMGEGVINAAKVLEAAGATHISSPHPRPVAYRPGPGAHERWAEEVRTRGFGRDVTYYTWHQMGSCRMGVDPSSSAIGAENETHEVRDLYVMDASTFPTASGVNPMISIYAIAHRAAGKLAQKLS